MHGSSTCSARLATKNWSADPADRPPWQPPGPTTVPGHGLSRSFRQGKPVCKENEPDLPQHAQHVVPAVELHYCACNKPVQPNLEGCTGHRTITRSSCTLALQQVGVEGMHAHAGQGCFDNMKPPQKRSHTMVDQTYTIVRQPDSICRQQPTSGKSSYSAPSKPASYHQAPCKEQPYVMDWEDEAALAALDQYEAEHATKRWCRGADTETHLQTTVSQQQGYADSSRPIHSNRNPLGPPCSALDNQHVSVTPGIMDQQSTPLQPNKYMMGVQHSNNLQQHQQQHTGFSTALSLVKASSQPTASTMRRGTVPTIFQGGFADAGAKHSKKRMAPGTATDVTALPVVPCYYSLGEWLPLHTQPNKKACEQSLQVSSSATTCLPTSNPQLAHQLDVSIPTGQNDAAAAITVLPHSTSTNSQLAPAQQHVSGTQKPGLRQKLSDWMPHPGVLAAYESNGITSLYPWQAAAMECGEWGNNLVYCAPTSGGKSMVAELLLIRQLLKFGSQRKAFGRLVATPARALLVLPYISIVSEKAAHMSKILSCLGGNVKGYLGDDPNITPLQDKDEILAVVTMEKANTTLNRIIAQQRVQELVCVVIDEAHMVSDPSRGLVLELLLTKLMHAAACRPEVAARLQIIAMSATISGLEHMREWLNARLFMTNFRPVPLTEHVVFGRTVFRKLSAQEAQQVRLKAKQQAEAEALRQQQLQQAMGDEFLKAKQLEQQASTNKNLHAKPTEQKALQQQPETPKGFQTAAETLQAQAQPSSGQAQGPVPGWDVVEEQRVLTAASSRCDGLVPLVAEVTEQGHSVLVFCAARKSCESVGRVIADALSAIQPATAGMASARKAVIEQLRIASGGVENTELEHLIMCGVAYHHAGLTTQERTAVESAYRSGAVLVITATSTLAAGINLPARRVILRSLQQGTGPVSRAQYLQMIGRAGRAGQSAIGEAFIIGCGKPRDYAGQWLQVCKLLTAALPPLRSRMLDKADGTVLPQLTLQPPSGRSSGGGNAAQVAEREIQQRNSGAHPTHSTGVTHIANVDTSATTDADGCHKKQGPNVYEETNLQHVLLEAIANGLVSCQVGMETLLRSTLSYQQLPWQQLQEGLRKALRNLQAAGLITTLPTQQVQLEMDVSVVSPWLQKLQSPAPLNGSTMVPVMAALPPRCESTHIGKAVFGSSLPLHQGMEMYKRLAAMQESGCVLGAGALHPIVAAMTTEHEAFEIGNWKQWARLLRSLGDAERQVATLYGVMAEYAERVPLMRSGPKPDMATRHARFAAALCANSLLCEGELTELEQLWSDDTGILKKGVTRGMLQGFQKQLSKSAGMASQLCHAAGWWQTEIIMTQLAEQANAGARPELFKLMQVPGLRDAPARARQLYERGVHDAAALAAAPLSLVQKAVAEALPRNMRDKNVAKDAAAKAAAKGTAAAFSEGNASKHMLVNRIATTLVKEAKDVVVNQAIKVLEAVAAISADSVAGDVGDGDGSHIEGHIPDAQEVAEAIEKARAASIGSTVVKRVHGTAKLHVISDSSHVEAVQRVKQHITAALRLGFAFVLGTPGDTTSQQNAQLNPHQQEQQQQERHEHLQQQQASNELSAELVPDTRRKQLYGVVVVWSDTQCAWLRINNTSAGSLEAEVEALKMHPLWETLAGAVANPDVVKCCFDATSHIAMLLACGVDVWPTCIAATKVETSDKAAQQSLTDTKCGSMIDAQLLLWLLTRPGPVSELTVKDVQSTVLPDYRLRIPKVAGPHGMAVNTMVQSCFLAFSSSSVLEGMCQQSPGTAQQYQQVEAPLMASQAAMLAATLIPAPSVTSGTCVGQQNKHVSTSSVTPHVHGLHPLISSHVQAKLQELSQVLDQLFPQATQAVRQQRTAAMSLTDVWSNPAALQWICRHLHLVQTMKPPAAPADSHGSSDGADHTAVQLMTRCMGTAVQPMSIINQPALWFRCSGQAGTSPVKHLTCWLLTQLHQLLNWQQQLMNQQHACDHKGTEPTTDIADEQHVTPLHLQGVHGVTTNNTTIRVNSAATSNIHSYSELVLVGPRLLSLQQHIHQRAAHSNAQQDACHSWQGQTVLFDASQAVIASNQDLAAMGLCVTATNLSPSKQIGMYNQTSSGRVRRVCEEPALCTGLLREVTSSSNNNNSNNTVAPSAPPFHCIIAIIPPSGYCLGCHVIVPCHSVWLLSAARWTGSLAAAVQQQQLHSLRPVQVCLEHQLWRPVLDHPTYGTLRILLPCIPLVVLSHLCDDAELSILLSMPDPYASIAEAWLPGCTLTPSHLLLTTLQRERQHVVELLQQCGIQCNPTAITHTVQQLLTSWLLGEKPYCVACRLQQYAAASGMPYAKVNRHAAKQLQSCFLDRFPGLSQVQAVLLDNALTHAGSVVGLLPGCLIRVDAVSQALTSRGTSRKPFTPSAQAALQRSVMREVSLSCTAHIARSAAAFAFSAAHGFGGTLKDNVTDGHISLKLPVRTDCSGCTKKSYMAQPDTSTLVAIHTALSSGLAQHLGLEKHLRVTMLWSTNPQDSTSWIPAYIACHS